jgi:hypothetical protein
MRKGGWFFASCGGCEPLWGQAIVYLERTRTVAAILITQAVRGLVHVAAVAKKLDGPLYSQPHQVAAMSTTFGK